MKANAIDVDLHRMSRQLAADIVTAYVQRNPVAATAMPGLITSVYGALLGLGPRDVEEKRQEPAVPIARSITPDYLICLEDGKKLKMLKRHLRTAYDMTPDEYRLRWGLAEDYPMVAPNYAARRAEVARELGFGGRSQPA